MTDLSALAALCREIGCACREAEPMRLHTSFKIGGPADLFLAPDSEAQIVRILSAAAEWEIPLHVIGRGTDLLVSDEGVRGAVLAVTNRLSHMELLDERTISCAAGAPLEALCRYALEQGLSGLEFAFGIPGSVGGAVYMNAGAYGGEMRDVLQSAAHVTQAGESGSHAGGSLALSYRHSVYAEQGGCITGAVVRLTPGDRREIAARMEDFKRRRKEKQPLEYPSAGSTFKRPQGAYASALIDSCGLKGLRVGGAMVSEKHAGFIINAGGATCADVRALIEEVQRTVLARTGFSLECEVKML